MVDSKRVFKVFIGGPEDVEERRRQTEKIISNFVGPFFRDDFDIEFFSWDGLNGVPFRVGLEPQELIMGRMNPGACDVAIFVFKWRFGSPGGLGTERWESQPSTSLKKHWILIGRERLGSSFSRTGRRNRLT